MTTAEIPLSQIVVRDRAREEYDVEDLVESIRQVGLLQPVIVRPAGDGYELVAGGRRLRALEMLGHMLARCEVRDLADPDAELVEAIENGVRKAFLPSEAAALGMRLEERARADEEFLGKLPTGDRLSERVARAVGMGDRTYRKARDVLTYEPTSDDGREYRAALEARMDESGTVDGAHHQLRALEVAEGWLTHDLDDVRTAAAKLLARAAWDDGDLADEVAGLTGWVEQEEAFSAAAPQAVEEADGADPAHADEHPAVSGEGDSGSEEEPESTPDEIPSYLLPDRWFPAPSWPTHGTWTILTERVADDRRPRYRYWLNAGRSGVHSGAYQPDENAAVEDYLDHAWPGWRDLPPVPKCPDHQGVRTIEAWFEATALVLPDGWLADGGPILTHRGASGHRHHLAGRGPWQGIDCAFEAIHNEADDAISPERGVEVSSEPEEPEHGDLQEGEPVPPAGSSSTTPLRKREPRKAPPVKRAESERLAELVSELAEAVQSLPADEVVRWLATHGDTGGAPGVRLRSDLTVLVPYLREVQLLTAVG